MPMVSSYLSDSARRTLLSLFVLGLFWACVWILNATSFPQLLGWDEVLYLSEAKGIALDGDFSARQLNTLGILKLGFPTHLANYPIYSSILAGFFALFGVSLSVAHAMNWLAALGVMLVLFALGRRLGFGHSVSVVLGSSFLLTPGVMRHVDTAMMETVGALLLALFAFTITSRLGGAAAAGKILPALGIGLFILLLWLFKTIFVGVPIGVLAYMLYVRRSEQGSAAKGANRQRGTFRSAAIALLLIFGAFAAGYTFLTRAVFLPLAPQYIYDPGQLRDGAYGEFAGGFFRNTGANLVRSARHIVDQLSYHGVYRAVPTPYSIGFLTYVHYYFFLLAGSFILLAACRRSLSQSEKRFAVLTVVSLAAFYAILHIVIRTVPENVHRYSIYYLPLYLPLVAVTLRAGSRYLAEFVRQHRTASRLLLALIILVFWLPLFLTMAVHQLALERQYHRTASENHDAILSVIDTSRPSFIYFTHGTHTTFLEYPTRQIALDTTSEELIKVNSTLPEPVQFLFLRPKDSIYREHETDIRAGKPILGAYEFRGSRLLGETGTIVYAYEYVPPSAQ